MQRSKEVKEQFESKGILSDEEISKRLRKDLFIHPLLDEQTQIAGCKVDLHLGNKFHEVKYSALEIYDPLSSTHKDYIRTLILRPGEAYILHPGALVLVPAFENISLPPDLLGILQGRSSIGRLGVIVHATAGFVDPGYRGTIILELSNLGHLPLKLTPLLKVATIAFAKIEGQVKKPYGTKVRRDLLAEEIRMGKHDSPTFLPSKLNEDWESRVLAQIAKINHH
jgi:dCTP deaminase